MPLVQAKCTNCGANLEVENTKDAAICPYCGTPYIVEKAINHYNTTNNISNNISADVVNIYGSNLTDFAIRAGRLEKYNGASTSVVIPNNVIAIGDSAFADCRGLVSITIPGSVTEIGNSAFRDCVRLAKITIPSSVTRVGDFAFCNCSSLKEISLSDNITFISNGMFCGCSKLSIVHLPSTIAYIGNNAFRECSNLTDVQIPNVQAIGSYAFDFCRSLQSIIIPTDVSKLERCTFEGCVSLRHVIFPEKLTEIGELAFHYCSSLRDINFPDELLNIKERAFFECSSLNKIVIPEKVSRIGEWAFRNCNNLTAVQLLGNPLMDSCSRIDEDGPLLPSSEWGVFSGCDNLTVVEASEEWKRKNYNHAKCLAPYQNKGCYIATAVYGSYNCPQVWTLRRFRDYTLAKTWYGRAFIRCYYALSPALVKWFGGAGWFRRFWKRTLDKLVGNLNEKGVANTPYNDG